MLPWIVAGLVALSLFTLAPRAEAGPRVSIGIGIGVPFFAPPVYAYPYYVAPPPPPVIYAPAPAYYYYGPPRRAGWYGHGHGRGHGWGHRGHWD